MLLSRKELGGLLVGGLAAATAGTAAAQTATPVPVSGKDVFEILEQDHKRIHAHLDKLVTDPASRQETLAAVSMLFTVHNATEENFVYPAVAKVAMLPNDSETLFHQQDEAKSVVWQLHEVGRSDGYASEKFTALAKKLLAAALSHVQMEEKEDFPKLRKALGSERVAILTADVAAFRKRFA